MEDSTLPHNNILQYNLIITTLSVVKIINTQDPVTKLVSTNPVIIQNTTLSVLPFLKSNARCSKSLMI